MKHTCALYLVLFSLSFALGACSEKNTTPTPTTIDFGANEGYTGRDDRGVPTGPVDPTDWTVDATWNDLEKAIFERPYSISFDKQPAVTTVWKGRTYPNPVVVNGTSIMSILLDRPTSVIPAPRDHIRIVYAVVDSTYAVKTSLDTGGINANFGDAIVYDASKFRPNMRYRVYYVIYNDRDETIYFKGHGDIKVIP